MDEKQSHSLILRPSSALEKLGAGPKAIMDGMVSDALALVQSHDLALAAKLFRIGDYEFCDPDYRQILILAKALRLKPNEVLERLLRTEIDVGSGGGVIKKLEIVNGHIVKLVWDFELLPIPVFEWVNGLCIQSIAFKGEVTASVAIKLSMLQELYCFCIGLEQINLSNVPNLTKLVCYGNLLNKLDLSNVPNLKTLWCHKNQLSELDLSNIPNLTRLVCFGNLLNKLDLSNVPNLTGLGCRSNLLNKLDLSNVPNLKTLWCHDNQLSELDLSNVTNLKTLWCQGNQITKLDIQSLNKLTKLHCDPSVIIKKLPTQNF